MLRRHPTLTIAAILTLALAGAALADDDRTINHRMVIVGDHGDHATVTLDGGRLQVVSVESGVHRVHEIDLSMLGALIDGAVSTALSSLEDGVAAEVHVDNEHRFRIRRDRGVHTIDLSGLAERLEESLAHLHTQLDLDLGHLDHHDVRVDLEPGETEQLREELDDLKAELEDLRRELRDLR